MTDHTQPTREELEANIKASQDALATLDTTPKDDTPADNTPADDTPKDDTPVDKADDATPDDTLPADNTPKDQEPSEDWKKRYTESSREAIVLHEQNKKKDAIIQAANELPEPTEEDLKVEAVKQGFNYEDMDPVLKTLFKNSVHTAQKLNKITEVAQEGKDLEAWYGKVDTFIEDPKALIANPRLEGKQEEFKIFAAKKTHRGVDFSVLVGAFLHEIDTTRPLNKGKKMFEQGGGGVEKGKPKTDRLSPQDENILRETDYKGYVEYIKKHKATV